MGASQGDAADFHDKQDVHGVQIACLPERAVHSLPYRHPSRALFMHVHRFIVHVHCTDLILAVDTGVHGLPTHVCSLSLPWTRTLCVVK